MSGGDLGQLAHLLRNTAVRLFLAALERDGFLLRKTGQTGSSVYKHPDGRTTVIHYHRGNDTLTPGTLRNVIDATGWTLDDAKRPRLTE